jgi:hypothetical protein
MYPVGAKNKGDLHKNSRKSIHFTEHSKHPINNLFDFLQSLCRPQAILSSKWLVMALAVARCLSLAEPKIMVTSNASKLEAWITMKKFVGEDEDA